MNLIIDPNPKDDQYSVNGALAQRLANVLGGPTSVIRLYEADQKYFNYEYNQEWMNAVLHAQRLVFPVPMWNMGIPAALKDFFDKITKRGQLWDFDENKKYIGLLKEKSAFIIMTSGDVHTDDSPNDFVVPYLKAILGFFGIADVKAYRLGGVRNKNLAADPAYMEEKTGDMLKTFALNRR